MKALAAAPVTPETATEAVVSEETATEQAASTPAEVTIQSWDKEATNQENTKSLQKIYTHNANL